jgi:precorrin-2 dehydrogenase/sirohydrochlorin ferrochelatase
VTAHQRLDGYGGRPSLPIFGRGKPVIPVALDPKGLSIAVAGRGAAALRRFRALHAAGAADLVLFSDQPDEALLFTSSDAFRPRLPRPADLLTLRALWIAGLPDTRAAELGAVARSHHVLVNVEDQPALSDFHSVAEVRRGDLLLTVSTGGASPGLAARIRARLEAEYGSEWADRLTLLRERRTAWRRDGRQPSEVAELTDVLLHASGWLA